MLSSMAELRSHTNVLIHLIPPLMVSGSMSSIMEWVSVLVHAAATFFFILNLCPWIGWRYLHFPAFPETNSMGAGGGGGGVGMVADLGVAAMLSSRT